MMASIISFSFTVDEEQEHLQDNKDQKSEIGREEREKGEIVSCRILGETRKLNVFYTPASGREFYSFPEIVTGVKNYLLPCFGDRHVPEKSSQVNS